MKPLKQDSKQLERTSPVKTHKVVYGRPEKKETLPKTFIGIVCATFFLLGISAGFLLHDTSFVAADNGAITTTQEQQEFLNKENIPQEYQNANIDYSQFWVVWSEIKKSHIDQDASDAELFYGALKGMVGSTNDPYSEYFTPEEAAQLKQQLQNGSFEGIGAEIGKKDDYLVVIAPLPNSPAEQAGLQAGDIITKIDDQDAIEMSIDYGIFLIRGEKGTTVVLTVLREGEEEPLEIAIERNTIDYKNVEWSLIEKDGKKIVYIELREFSEDAAQLMQEAVNEFLLENPDGIIVDVRNNGGGVVSGAVSIASLFLDDDTPILIEQFFDGKEEIYKTEGTHPLKDIPTVVLLNGGSASASEIVAGALRDYDRATLIGTTSFGKGTVQTLVSLSDSSLLKLTHAKWLTPNREQINDVGIDPDYVVEREEDDFADEKDTQKDAAVLYLTDVDAFTKKYPQEKEENTEKNQENQKEENQKEEQEKSNE